MYGFIPRGALMRSVYPTNFNPPTLAHSTVHKGPYLAIAHKTCICVYLYVCTHTHAVFAVDSEKRAHARGAGRVQEPREEKPTRADVK